MMHTLIWGGVVFVAWLVGYEMGHADGYASATPDKWVDGEGEGD